MKNLLLIPNRFKVIGWVTFILFAFVGLGSMYFEMAPSLMMFNVGNCDGKGGLNCVEVNFLYTIALTGTIIGLLFISFSKEKNEDEYISFLRLKNWQWSVLISYAVLIVFNFCVYSTSFLVVMLYNMFTVLIVFIIKFNYSLYKLRNEGTGDEK